MKPDEAGRRKPADESDADLLRRFADGRDESAFAALVARHAPLVLGSCRRMLRNRQDVEDAFQAVFLTLADRAKSLRRARSLPGWLYGVAVRVSLRVRRKNSQWRRAMTHAEQTMQSAGHDADAADAISLLDEELARLPERYRNVLVLCDLQGRSQKEAAHRLAVPLGTVSSLLVRGRKLLRDALVRRGAALSAAGLAGVLSEAAQAAGPASAALVPDTTRGALFFLAGKSAAAGGASARVTTLVHEMRRVLMLAKLKLAVCFAAAAAALGVGSPSVSSNLGLMSAARAQSFFYDDFEDGSAIDGDPVTWFPEVPPFPVGAQRVESGSLILTPARNEFPWPGFYETDWEVHQNLPADVVLRTRVRALGTSGLGYHGVYARDTTDVDVRQGSYTAVLLTTNGDLSLLVGTNLDTRLLPEGRSATSRRARTTSTWNCGSRAAISASSRGARELRARSPHN